MPELNDLAPIQERTRLIVGDILEPVLNPEWTKAVLGDSIMMSYDPVAVDSLSLEVGEKVMADGDQDKAAIAAKVALAQEWLANAAELQLGTSELQKMEIAEETLQ